MESQLPDEIWLEVIAHVKEDKRGKKRLRPLSRCTKQLRRICLPDLWSSCRLDIENTTRVCELMRLMQNNRFIAEAIENMHLCGAKRDDKRVILSARKEDNLQTIFDQIPGISANRHDEIKQGSKEALLSLMVEIASPSSLTIEVQSGLLDLSKFWSSLTEPTLQRLNRICVHGQDDRGILFPASQLYARSLELSLHPGTTSYPKDLFSRLHDAYSGNIETFQKLTLRDCLMPRIPLMPLDLRDFMGLRYLSIPFSWLMGSGLKLRYVKGKNAVVDNVKKRIHTLLPPRLKTLNLSMVRRIEWWEIELLKKAIRHLLKAPIEPGSVTSSLESIEIVLSELWNLCDRRFDYTPIMGMGVHRSPPIQITMVCVRESSWRSTRMYWSFQRLCEELGVWHSTTLLKEGRFTRSDDPADVRVSDDELVCGNGFWEGPEQEVLEYTYAPDPVPSPESSDGANSSDFDLGF